MPDALPGEHRRQVFTMLFVSRHFQLIFKPGNIPFDDPTFLFLLAHNHLR